MPRGRPRKNPEDVLIKSAELIGWALGGLEREIVETKNRLAALTAQAAQLRGRVAGRGAAAPAASAAAPAETAAGEGGRKKRRRKMSPEARKRISEMMKKRWAERRKK
jgi:pyruvate/2-oxoglutarate dehydrogenase complex dihydrolipoamide acyltransferase (E2) component